jgi:hypothetical protein
MMRKDHDDIKKATALCMTTTEKGHEYLETLSDTQMDEATGLDELLLLMEDEYVILSNEDDIDKWVQKIQEEHLNDEFRAEAKPITKEIILEGIEKGYIGFTVVIWD